VTDAAPDRVRLVDVLRGLTQSLPRVPGMLEAARVALRSDTQRVESIGAVLERNAAAHGGGIALRFEDLAWTHAELDARANRVARALASMGVVKRDAVAVAIDNRPALLVVVAALAKLGAVPALLNTNQRGRVLAHSMRVAGCTSAVIGAELWDAFAEVRREVDLSGPERVAWVTDRIGALGDGDGAPKTPRGPRSATDLAAVAREQSAATTPWTASVRVGDPCFYIFTSGTTGLPKASVMTHMRWVKAGYAFGRAALALTPDSCVYAPLPLYHNQALTVAWASAAVSGAALAFRPKFSASAFWDDCRRFGADAVIYIGELPRYLLNQPKGDHERDHRVRAALGNGLRADVWHPFKERFGIGEVFEIYAASEANTVFFNALNLERTVGICPTPHAIVRYDVERGEPVRNARGWMERVGVGETGLLLGKVSDRFRFDGYTDPRASEKKLLRDVFERGDVWFDSGDLLRRLGWGHAAFVDRIGDTFRWKSENVSTSEVELIVNQHPAVRESTVYGVELPGNEGRAGMVSLNVDGPAESFDFEALLSTCRRELPSYAIPLFVRVRSGLDTTGTFKHQKQRLRDEAWRCEEPVWVLWPGSDAYVRLRTGDEERIATERW
jgi:acyl-CoA synthetase (AMP-forming)/AMP-acid ligase II